MSYPKDSLYRWDRFAKPKERVYSRSQRVANDGDIQSWIKKVEAASEQAAAEVFSGDVSRPRRRAGHEAALATIENLHQHESAYEEAHDLLQQWMQDSTLDRILGEPEPEEAPIPRSKTSAEVKREWDHLVEQNENQYGIDLNLDDIERKKKDVFSIYETDSDVVVDDILQKLMAKPIVPNTFMEDLGLEKKTTSPTMKMQLRQQQVKENRERRMQQLEKKRREQQAKKEAQFQARQLLKKEEQTKLRKQREEETEIERHMAVIRREMEEQHKKKTTAKYKEEMEQAESARRVEAEYQNLLEMELAQKRQARLEEEVRRRRIELRLKEVEARQDTENLKLLHRCFSSWYQCVIERRLQMGKAAAMCDWKMTLRHWNAWRAYTRSQQMDKHAKSHHQHILDMHRKERTADRHYRSRLLRKCMIAWQLYVQQCHQSEAIQQSQHATRTKMAAFLQAAQQGRLWSDGKEDGDLRKSQSLSDLQNQNDIDEFFHQKPQRGQSAGGSHSARSKGSKSGHRPKAAWQLTRDDALTKEERAQLSQRRGSEDGLFSGPASSHTSARSGKQPWEKAPFVPDTFQHRHQAQQKLLEQQQKQLKEQQRLMQEMQYLQRQQLLQQQLSRQQQITQLTGEAGPTKLQQHLEALKKELVASGVDVDKMEAVEAMFADKGPEGMDTDRNSAVPGGGDATGRTDSGWRDSSRSDNPVECASTARPTDTGRSATTANSTSRTNNSRHTKFLQDMESRAAERARLKKEREDKRRKAEEERLAALEAEKVERLAQEEAAKQARIEAHREKKRLEKQREVERQQQLEHQRHQMAVAEEHHRLAGMRYRGWVPWQRLVTMAKEREEKAQNHYKKTLLRKCMLSWHQCVRQEVSEKESLADDHFSFLLLRRCFNNWRKVGECLAIQEEKAQRFYEGRLRQRFLRAWADYTEDEKMAMWKKERLAREHDLRRIQKKYFHVLRYFPEIIKQKKEKEKRREELRKKVASMLPDFEGFPEKKTGASESFDFG